MSTTLDIDELCGSLCDEAWKPALLEGIALSWLRHHFGDAARIANTQLRSHIWSSDKTASKILIEPIYLWAPETADQRPTILVFDAGVSPLPSLFGNRIIMGGADAARDVRTTLLQGTMHLRCLSRLPAEVRALSFEVFQEIMAFGPLVAQKLGLAAIRTGPLPGPQRAQELPQAFLTSVTLSYGFWWGREIIPANAQKLAKTELTL
jgi:hypothetical protein